MNATILHVGALGDLLLTLRLAERIPPLANATNLTVVSRVAPPRAVLRSNTEQRAVDGIGLEWLFRADDAPPPETLAALVRGAVVLSALDGAGSAVHARLAILAPRVLLSVDPRPDPASQRHIVDQWCTQIERQGQTTTRCIVRSRAKRLPRRAADGSFVIHPGGGSPAKCWPLDAWIEVGRALSASSANVGFVLGHVERERWPAPAIDAIRRGFPLALPDTVDDLAAILATARVVLSNDSGPAHLAAALHAPQVVLFGPTDARIWRPLSPATRAIQGDPRAGARWGIDVADLIRAAAAVSQPTAARRGD